MPSIAPTGTTLSDGTSTLALPDDLLWTDEFDWAPVANATARSVTGRLLVEAAGLTGGRPITLTGGDDYGWIDRSTLEALHAWAGRPAVAFTLTLRGVQRSVIFATAPQGAIEAKPVVDYALPEPADDYVVTLKFIEVP